MSAGSVSSFLGSPLKQIREFVKDILYRNKSEKVKSQIDIEKERLSLINGKIDTLEKLGFSKDEIRKLLSQEINLKLENSNSNSS